jgi:hypothetical protein
MGDYGKNGIIYNGENPVDLGEQPLTEAEKQFRDSITALFETFKRGNTEALTRMATARKMRKLIDVKESGKKNAEKFPQLNTLNSTIDNMVADYIDNMPEALLMSETLGSEETAREMTDVLGWVFHHADLPAEWMDAMEDLGVTGSAVLQEIYDPDEVIGGEKGNIVVQHWPPESWLADPLYDDFQLGRAVFKVIAHPRSWFYQHYPEYADYIQADSSDKQEYDPDGSKVFVDALDDGTVSLLEVWYRRYNAEKKRYEIHMAKVAGGCLLEDSRTGFGYPDGKGAPNGVYDHGMYPFTLLRFRKHRGTPYGTGLCWEFADTQDMINRYIKYIDANVQASSRFKLIVSEMAGINQKQLLDWNQEVITTKNGIAKEGIEWFQPQPLNSLVPTMMGTLQDTMKQDSGQNQWSRGEGGQGVTAASAINALQNAGGKISRMHINSMLVEFKTMCERVISLIGQYFNDGRIFAIYGENNPNEPKTVALDKKKVFGELEAYKKPAFTVRVQPQSSSPDQVEAHNNRVFKVGDVAAQSNMPIPPVDLVKMLIMQGKDQIVPVLEKNDQMRQMMQQLQQQVEQDQQQLQAMAKEYEQLQKAAAEMQGDLQKKNQIIAAVGQQMAAKKQQPQPAPLPAAPQQPAPQANPAAQTAQP